MQDHSRNFEMSRLLTRRQTLQIGSLGLAGLSLPRLLQANEQADSDQPAPRADACLVIFLNGGPSHLDMWDMKPKQADGIRGEFDPISTSLADYHMCEHLPRLAQLMHRSTVVRSMNHSVNNSHASAVYTSLTGHDRGEVNGGAQPGDNPNVGSVLAMARPPEKVVVPHVHLPYITAEGKGGPPQPGFFGGFLGQSHDPFFVLDDPNRPDFSIPELTLLNDVSSGRLANRRILMQNLDRFVQQRARVSAPAEMNRFQQKALDILTSQASQQAFQVSRESDAVRDSYGRNIYGQSTLLARRLIEAGSRMVTVSWAPDANATWDTHGNNFKTLKTTLLPQLDAAASSLITDLSDRGMLERTVVAIFGDFGRSPRVNPNAGREHWNFCYSLMMVGGGFREGLVHGASDATGAFPKSDPLIPGDVISTLYHVLGVRHDKEIYDRLNRPYRLVPTGDVVADLLA
jgi:hypothetical protein